MNRCDIRRDLQIKIKDIPDKDPLVEVEAIPVIGQMPELPTGCEATAATMLLQWAGVDVTKEDIANSLVKGPAPKSMDGILYGANPNRAFVGDPFSIYGYGVFHEPIADVLNTYLEGSVHDATGISFKNLLKILSSGRPVIAWATIDMKEPRVSKTWYDEYGNEVVWKTPEHALVLVGYTKNQIIAHDPYTGSKVYYPISAFESNWEAMGRQAVTVEERFVQQVKDSRSSVTFND